MMKRCILTLATALLFGVCVVNSAAAQGKKPDDPLAHALQQLQRAHQQHIQVLNGLLDKVPAQARPGILNAIERSQKGMQTAQAALQKRRAAMAGKKGKGKPDGVGGGKPAGVGKDKPPFAGKGKGKGKGKPGGVGKGKGGGKPAGVGKGGKGKGRGKR